MPSLESFSLSLSLRKHNSSEFLPRASERAMEASDTVVFWREKFAQKNKKKHFLEESPNVK